LVVEEALLGAVEQVHEGALAVEHVVADDEAMK
jgi:hypothetical protein